MNFNFGKFNDMIKKFGAKGKWDGSTKKLTSSIKSMKIYDEQGKVIDMIPKSEANTAGKVLGALAIAQTADEAIDLLAKTPVNEFFKVMQAGQVLPSKYTIGMIPGLKNIFNWINDKVLGALKYICNAVGFQGIAKATDDYQQLWEQGFKAIGNSKGYKNEGGNHDEWWQAKGQKLVVFRGLNAYSRETASPSSNRKALTGMVILEDYLYSVAMDKYNTASGVVNPFADLWTEVIAKYLTYLNFTQTLTQTAITNYLRAVASMYAMYVAHKKYYNCRNTPMVASNPTQTVYNAYVSGSIVVNGNLGNRTSFTTLNMMHRRLNEYVEDKYWNNIEAFLSRQYLPKKIKEYIENMYGHFYQYRKDVMTLVSIDPREMETATSSSLTSYTKVTDGYDSLMSYINAQVNSCTASLHGFLAKCGIEQLVIPDEFIKTRSKDGTEELKCIVADDTMRHAINNTFTYMNNQGYGYRYNTATDELLIDAGESNCQYIKFSNNNTKDSIRLDSEEANYLSKVLKFNFTARLLAISVWSYDPITLFGIAGFANGWVESDVLPSGGSTISRTNYNNAVNAAAAQAGRSNETLVSDILGLEFWFDGHFQITWNYVGSDYSGSVNIVPNKLTYETAETVVTMYSRLKDTALLSIASDHQYETAITKFISELSKAVDLSI